MFILFFSTLSNTAYAQDLRWVEGKLYFYTMIFPCSFYSNQTDCEAINCCWCTAGGASNCQICPCPTIQPPISPGGPGGAFIPPEKKNETNVTVPPLFLSTNTIEVRLYPGEYQIVSVGITNNENDWRTVKLSVEGDIWPYTLFEKDTFPVDAGETYFSNIKFYTLPTTLPGIYNGNIVVRSGNITRRIAVILRVEYKTEKLLDIKLNSITKNVYPGDRYKYMVTLYNLGLTKRECFY